METACALCRVTNATQGLSYALDAINALNDRFTLTIIGQKAPRIVSH